MPAKKIDFEKNDNAWVQACSSFLIYLGGDVNSLGKLLSKRKYTKVENCARQLKQGCNTAVFVSQLIDVSSSLEAAKLEYESMLNSFLELADETQKSVIERQNGDHIKAALHVKKINVLKEDINKRFSNISALLGR